MKRLASRLFGKQKPNCSPVPYSFTIHGTTIEDPFRWLHDLENRKVRSYVDQENKHFDRYFRSSGVHPYVKAVSQELANNADEERGTTMAEYAYGYYYYSREEPGENFALFCRKKTLDSPEEVFLDVNKEGIGQEYISVKNPVISVDQQRVAFAKCYTAEEKYQGVIKSITTQKVLSTLSSVFSMIFTFDNNHIIYTKQDALRRPSRVYLHKIGSAEENDILVYEEHDDSVFLDVTLSKDNQWIIISANSKNTSEIRVIKSSDPYSKPIVVHKRKEGVRFFLDHAGDRFYCVTNEDQAHNYKLLVANSTQLLSAIKNNKSISPLWIEMVPHRTSASILDVDIFENNIVTYICDNGRHQIHVYDEHNIREEPYIVPLPNDIGYIEPGGNVDYNSSMLRFSFSSPIHPEMVFDFDLKQKCLKKLRESKMNNYFPGDMSCERISVLSEDGEEIPITITRQNNLNVNKEDSPILLHVYGAYGHSIDPYFRSKYIPLWNRGWSIGTVHVRGGGEKGELWHQKGTLLNKTNSFIDFISCAKFVRDKLMAHPSKICAASHSAGGLVLGAACNMEPSLFNSMIMKVPFVDSLTSMLNEELPLTIFEYPEWGNPTEDAEIFHKMRSYDPYLNLRDVKSLPSLYVTTSTLDYQVPFWGPVKWVAKMRASHKFDEKKELLLHVSENTSHSGDGGIHTANITTSRELAFLLHQTKSPQSKLPTTKE